MKGTKINIYFEESLSDSSINLIKKILKESLGYNTIIVRVNLK